MFKALSIGFLAFALVGFTIRQSCNELRLGINYAQVKKACPDIGTQAVDTLQGQPSDEPGRFPIYACDSQKTLVVGDRHTGLTVGLLQVTY